MSKNSSEQEWLEYPTGKIPQGSYCAACARFNNRPVACNAIILNEKNEVLLVKRAMDPQSGKLDIPGGYLDWDETLEAGTARELFEETGLRVDPSDFQFSGYFSNPNNSAQNQVVEMYFITKKFSGELQIDEAEVVFAQWYSLDALPESEIAFDHLLQLNKVRDQIATE